MTVKPVLAGVTEPPSAVLPEMDSSALPLDTFCNAHVGRALSEALSSQNHIQGDIVKMTYEYRCNDIRGFEGEKQTWTNGRSVGPSVSPSAQFNPADIDSTSLPGTRLISGVTCAELT